MKKTLSVIIPCYQSPPSLPSLLDDIIKATNSLPEVKLIEIICVIDGRWKDFPQRVSLGDNRGITRVVETTIRRGQQAATISGVAVSRGDLIVTMDDDGQHPASELGNLISAGMSSPPPQAAYGIPAKMHHSPIRNNLSRGLKLLLTALGVKDALTISSFRYFSSEIRSYLLEPSVNVASIDTAILGLSPSPSSVRLNLQRRVGTKSSYDLRSLLKFATNLIVDSSTAPLKISIWLGLIGMFAASGYGLWILIRANMFGGLPEGWASSLVLTAFLGSLNLFVVGTLGFYIARLFEIATGKSMLRPPIEHKL